MKYHRRDPLAILYYADALKANGKYEEAIEQYKVYQEKVPDDERGPKGASSCRKALEWIDQPSRYSVEDIKKINSKVDDFAPAFSDKFFNSIVFTSTRDGATGKDIDEWTGQNFSDLFTAKLDRKGSWSSPTLIDKTEKINTEANEGAATFNKALNVMYFTRCGNVRGEQRGCQIYTSKKRGKSYGAAEMLVLFSDTTTTFGHPTLSSDELMIIFSSDKEDSFGGKDLYYATRDGKNEEFGIPRNLGQVINTVGDEMFPFLRNDTVLYFASDRHEGMGGLDIFKSSIVDGTFTKPFNLKPPINSNADDFGIVFRDDEESGYFASNRRGGRGGDDIYSFIEPPVEFTLTGIIKDDLSLQYVEGASVKLIGSDGTSIEAKTDPKGYYNFSESQINKNTSYEIIVEKEDYFNTSGRITTVGLEGSNDFVRDFNLEPIPDAPIVLPDILYDLDKWDLKPQYQDSLQGLVKTLDQNPTIIIELASHTDARASDEYNDVLSQRRAESVVNYLIDRGIDPERLIAKGYGERVPRILRKDATRGPYTFSAGTRLTEEFIESLPTEEEKELAHQLNRRTEFSVISLDFIPKPTIEEIEEEEAVVDIVTEPEENSVEFIQGIGESIKAPLIANGYTIEFTYIKAARGTSISLSKALELLKDGAITKNDFEGDVNKILANGTISDRAILYLSEVKIGDNTVIDLPVTVIHNMQDNIVFGESTLKLFGKFNIDYQQSKIIFE